MSGYIAPSANFEGSQAETQGSISILKTGIREITFSKGANKEGIYLNFAPGYKVDSHGNGAWFRNIKVRTEFGLKFGARYVIHDDNDPVTYFDRNLRAKYPALAQPKEQIINNKAIKKAPPHGKVSNRVLFNVIPTQALTLGCHVLELPYSSGANKLNEYHNTKAPNGLLPDLICIPDKSVPVFVKMDKDATSPWTITPRPDSPIVLPPEYTYSENIYNLDDVTVHVTNEELLFKLREFTAPDIFADCMQGYPGISKHLPTGAVNVGFAASNPIAAAPVLSVPAVQAPLPAIPAVAGLQGAFPLGIPTANIPSTNVPSAAIPTTTTDNVTNPLAVGVSPKTKEDVMAFLKKGKA